MSPRLFISYDHQDAGWARRFANSLREKGVPVWFDEFEVSPGENLEAAFSEGLRGSESFVFVLSEELVASPWFHFELGAALGQGKMIIAVVPDDLEPSHIPALLQTGRSLRKHSPEDTAEELASMVVAAA